jgi:hypothetical protein
VHVAVIFGLVQLVDEYAVRQLNCNLVLVHSNFLDVVSAFDSDLFFGDQVLYDDISHAVSVRISIVKQSVNSVEDDLMTRNCAVVAAARQI